MGEEDLPDDDLMISRFERLMTELIVDEPTAAELVKRNCPEPTAGSE